MCLLKLQHTIKEVITTFIDKGMLTVTFHLPPANLYICKAEKQDLKQFTQLLRHLIVKPLLGPLCFALRHSDPVLRPPLPLIRP